MVAQKIVKAGGTASAQRMTVKFVGAGGSMSDEGWYASDVRATWGKEAGKAVIQIGMPQAIRERTAGNMALDLDGPLGFLKKGTLAIVYRSWVLSTGTARSEVVFMGRVQNVNPLIADESGMGDRLSVELEDLKDDLREVRVVGRTIYNPDTDEESYQMGWPAEYNPGGRPNCIFNKQGRPRVAPHPDYGLEDDDEPPSPDDQSFSQACHWTLTNLFLYLFDTLGPKAVVPTKWPWIGKIPTVVEWPENLGGGLDEESEANFDDGRGQGNSSKGQYRKARQIVLEGMDILEAMDLLLSTAGGWTIDLQPKEDESAGASSSILVVVPKVFANVRGAIDLPHAMGSTLEATRGRAIVTGGSVQLDGKNYFSAVAAAGGLVKFERMMDSTSDQEGGLDIIWNQTRFDAFCTKIVDLGNDEEAFNDACNLFPDVLTQYILSRANPLNFMASTPYAGYPRANIGRPILPRMLSRMENGAADYQTWPMWVEVLVDSTWTLTPVFNGYQPWDNGIFEFTTLRELGLNSGQRNWEASTSGTAGVGGGLFKVTGGKANITPRKIRMNVPVAGDHRVTYSAKLPSHPGQLKAEGAESAEVLQDSPDAAFVAPDYGRTLYMDLGELYQLWFRYKSAPQPRSRASLAADLNSFASAVRNDLDGMKSHVRRTIKTESRIERGGHLRVDGYLGALKPGTAISTLFPLSGNGPVFPLRALISATHWVSGDRNTKTYYELS